MRNRRKGHTLETFFPIAQYMAFALIALSFPQLPETVRLLPGVSGARLWLMLWLPLLMGIAAWMDRAYLKAYRKDLTELQQKLPHGGLNRSTLLALGVPALLIVDAAAIAHLYYAYLPGEAGILTDRAVLLRTGALAVGVVLWIYGRMLPRIPYNSVWGIKTKKAMADVRTWGQVHLQARPRLCLCGAAALVAGLLLPGAAALGVAAAAGIAALVWVLRS